MIESLNPGNVEAVVRAAMIESMCGPLGWPAKDAFLKFASPFFWVGGSLDMPHTCMVVKGSNAAFCCHNLCVCRREKTSLS